MKIAIASDHAGYVQKEVLKKYLEAEGHNISDCGAFSEDRSDYPDFGHKVAKLVAQGEVERGVMVCGSGIGMCMVANRHKGVRAAVLHDENDAILSREHNDANVACFGSRVTSIETVKLLTDIFLKAPFAGGRHAARVEKIDKT
jgi:ribose 5-phosphate isomerase B